MTHERCFTSVNVGVRHESTMLTWEPTDGHGRETSRWRGTEVLLQPPCSLMTLRDSSALVYTWEYCSWQKSGRALRFLWPVWKYKCRKWFYWSLIDHNCGMLLPKATRTGIKRKNGGHKYVHHYSMALETKRVEKKQWLLSTFNTFFTAYTVQHIHILTNLNINIVIHFNGVF